MRRHTQSSGFASSDSAARHAGASPENDIPDFEAIFRVPAGHRLVAIRSRSRGGAVMSEFWEHEEYAPDGCLVARFETYEEIDRAGARRGCWRKFDSAGRLIRVGGRLQ